MSFRWRWRRRSRARRPQQDTFKAYWFSQTIGLDRGLQSFIQAMARTRTRVTLDIRGGNRWGHGERLVELARGLGIGDRVNLLPIAPPEEMVRLAASYDIGLSLETDVSENRRFCLTNKIFTYLLAGVPVLLSDTPAQRALAPDLGAAARLVSLADPAGHGGDARRSRGLAGGARRGDGQRLAARPRALQLGGREGGTARLRGAGFRVQAQASP